jgi:chorismate synthase
VVIRFLTAGESHGEALTAIVEGMPAGLPVTEDEINVEMARRQMGAGRGGRMKIERDRVHFTSGVRHGRTLGSPITMVIQNLDWENWRQVMAAGPLQEMPVPDRSLTRPRPGHADLAGALKYGHEDLRNVLERSSARETAARVAVGALCGRLLKEFGIVIVGHVVEIDGIEAADLDLPSQELKERAEASPVRCADSDAAARMVQAIENAREKGDTLGGVFEIIAFNVPVGLGSYVHWDRRLDGRLAAALMSIQAMKGVEIGLGFETARRLGSQVHDEIVYATGSSSVGPAPAGGYGRLSNNAGGIEGGVSNGQPIVCRVAMKPLSTLMAPKQSVDMTTKEVSKAGVERSDVCSGPSAVVVGEAMVAIEIARAFLEKFGGDSLDEIRRNLTAYQEWLKTR